MILSPAVLAFSLIAGLLVTRAADSAVPADQQESADERIWKRLQSFLTDYTWPQRKPIKSFIDRSLSDDRIAYSDECSRALHLFSRSIDSDAKWAFQGKRKAAAAVDRSIDQMLMSADRSLACRE